MSSMPLPELQLHTPPAYQPDITGDLLRIVQAQGINQQTQQQAAMAPGQLQLQQGQVQQQNLQLQDDAKWRSAMVNWDGSSTDSLLKEGLKQGVGPQSYQGMAKGLFAMQQQASTAGSDQLELQGKVADHISGQYDAMLNAPPEQKQTLWMQGKQQALQFVASQPGLNPQTQKQFIQTIMQEPDQYPGDDVVRSTYVPMNMMHSAIVSQAKTTAETNEASAKGAQATAEANLANANLPNMQYSTPEKVALLAQRGDPTAIAIQKNQQDQKVQVAQAEGQARANIEAQVARGGQGALAQVPPHLVPAATAAATKAGEDYAQAQSVTQRLQAMMDAAKQGNVVAYQIIPEEGTLQVTTSQGVHRINQAEIEQYAGGGSLWQRLQGHFGKALTGASIPSSVLDDMAQIQSIQQQGSQAKYNNSIKTINQNYGSTFNPVTMDNTGAGNQRQGGPPAGATHTARGSDGKNHYTNSQGQDLGVAP